VFSSWSPSVRAGTGDAALDRFEGVRTGLEGTRTFWEQAGANFTNRSRVAFERDASPFGGLTAAANESLNRNQLIVLNTLQGPGLLAPRDLERAVLDILSALKSSRRFR
jgi:hypothetical protein